MPNINFNLFSGFMNYFFLKVYELIISIDNPTCHRGVYKHSYNVRFLEISSQGVLEQSGW